jgi:hypothetical protein
MSIEELDPERGGSNRDSVPYHSKTRRIWVEFFQATGLVQVDFKG